MKALKKCRSGFTKGFLILLLLILAVLVVLFFPAIKGKPSDPGKTKVRMSVAALAVASKVYFTEFGQWPANTPEQVLVSTNIFNNRRAIAFFDFPNNRLLKSGSNVFFIDTWKRPYRIKFDVAKSGVVTSPANEVVKASVLVWSAGLDGIDGTADDFRSW